MKNICALSILIFLFHILFPNQSFAITEQRTETVTVLQRQATQQSKKTKKRLSKFTKKIAKLKKGKRNGLLIAAIISAGLIALLFLIYGGLLAMLFPLVINGIFFLLYKFFKNYRPKTASNWLIFIIFVNTIAFAFFLLLFLYFSNLES